eukprot:TRINITY_DN2942_c0_g2_i1.p1 TRINITY_DN2942_c0_g2~~TRINITY_DN2942_c0_g2_i1.p1  ORF type:complete len:376 (+),score=60.77 TRINITY_DN2942_c0_g2_i1:29-1156(+)
MHACQSRQSSFIITTIRETCIMSSPTMIVAIMMIAMTMMSLSLPYVCGFRKGMSLPVWGTSGLDSLDTVQSLTNMRNAGVDWIALVSTWYQHDINSTVIAPGPNTTPDNILEYIVGNATLLGMSVFLKPHVDPLDGHWRAWIGKDFTTPEQWDAWFQSYTAYIIRYARWAQSHRVSSFCVGVEMISASPQEAHFRRLIQQVRANFAGEVTYAANWGSMYQITAPTAPFNGEIDTITWLDALDVIGIDAYYYLTTDTNPSLETLMLAWTPISTHIAQIAAQHKKEVLFTEIGFRSIDGSAVHPGWWNNTAPYNGTQQALAYSSVFETFTQYIPTWWEGVFWWSWKPQSKAGGVGDLDFTPQNKPAQQVLQKYYREI